MSLELLLRRCLSVAVTLVLAVAAGAGAVTTAEVHVRFISGCTKVTAASLVMDGGDGGLQRIHLSLSDKDPCLWTGNTSASFSTELSHFSLRIDSGRTECRQAIGDGEDFKPVAVLDFACCNLDEPVRSVTISTEPPLPVSYLRVVPGGPSSDRLRSTPKGCIESGAFGRGAGTVDHVQFGGERLQLQLGFAKADPGLAGVSLNDLPDRQKSGVMEFTRKGVVYVLAIQRAKGISGNSPDLAPNAIDLDTIRLKELKLKKLSVDVK
ncbi:MAG TPA: hypothetical protein VEK57_05725 [Thermoanaerobaculia bacterium]|nr:hypothetical protein [Thermoanaerobaculia bacterium]